MLYVPLTAHPLGWLILGAGGYALYKAGKKKGEKEVTSTEIPRVPASLTQTATVEEKKGDR
ncbi:MAG: hypothetical protein CSA34_01710 [Desulfobulbus propionicus]|nr:MAG: hypothetical protein CSA34_01710 [Desulfobulbus propionicus]